MTEQELKILQGLDLETKVKKTLLRINDAINYFGEDGLYTSFSGGKDSTVLHHLVKRVSKKIPSVFINTGLEYPSIIRFAKSMADEIITPKMTFQQVIEKYGYPVVSKSQSFAIRKLTKQNLTEKYRNKLLYGDERGTIGRLSKKWHYLLDVDFDISEQCCDVMKKKPAKAYEKKTKRVPIIGTMAYESSNRKISYLKNGGCNAFNCTRPQSNPMGFWTEQDVLKFIKVNNIEIADIYGDIVIEDEKYKTTGESRTGCVFCMFGCHLEDKNNNRFIRLKEKEIKLYNYCMNGGKYNVNGKWIPHKGLGMKHVLDTLKVNY